jgi:hypothetical protein
MSGPIDGRIANGAPRPEFAYQVEVPERLPLDAVTLALWERRAAQFRADANYLPPLPETAEYDGDPASYVARLRAHNQHGQDVSSDLAGLLDDPRRAPTGAEQEHVVALVDEYLSAHSEATAESPQDPGAHDQDPSWLTPAMRTFLHSHVASFALYPRLRMYQEYDARRHAVVAARLSPDGEQALASGRRTLAAEAAAEFSSAVRAVGYDPPLPDMLRLPLGQQREITAELVQEGLAICRLIRAHDPGFSDRAMRPYSPLWHLTAAEISEAIAARPYVPPRNILRRAMLTPASFHERLAEYDVQHEAELRREEEHAKPGTLPHNRRQFRELAARLDVNQEVRRLEVGEPVLLGEPDRYVTRSQVEVLVRDHLQLMLLEGHLGDNPVMPGIATIRQGMSGLMDYLVPRKHWGGLSDLTLVGLPVDEAWLARHFPNRDDTIEDSIQRIGLGIHLISSVSRRNPIASGCELSLSRQPNADGQRVNLVIHPYAPDEDAKEAVRVLIAESRERAIRAYRYAISHPFRAGLPGGGRRA